MIQDFYSKLSEKERKLFYITVLVVVFALFDLLLLQPVMSKLKFLDEDVAEKRNSIIKDMRFLSYYDKIKKEQKAYSIYNTDEAKTEEEIIAGFLKTVELLASESSVNLIKVNPAGADTKKGYIQYYANLECNGTLESIVQFIHKIDTTNNLLKVVKIDMFGKKTRADEVDVSMRVGKLIIDPKTIGNYDFFEEEEGVIGGEGDVIEEETGVVAVTITRTPGTGSGTAGSDMDSGGEESEGEGTADRTPGTGSGAGGGGGGGGGGEGAGEPGEGGGDEGAGTTTAGSASDDFMSEGGKGADDGFSSESDKKKKSKKNKKKKPPKKKKEKNTFQKQLDEAKGEGDKIEFQSLGSLWKNFFGKFDFFGNKNTKKKKKKIVEKAKEKPEKDQETKPNLWERLLSEEGAEE